MDLTDTAEVKRLIEKGTVGECEVYIHTAGAVVTQLRGLMQRVHDRLEVAIAEERFAEISKRPPDFPPAQTIGTFKE